MTPTSFSFMDRFSLFKFFFYVAVRSWSTPHKSWQLFVDFVNAEQARKKSTENTVMSLVATAAEEYIEERSVLPVCPTTGKMILADS